MKAGTFQGARRPVSYDTGPCEGRQASPSNPSALRQGDDRDRHGSHVGAPQQTAGDHRDGRASAPPQASTADVLDARIVFRCTPAEKTALLAKAEASGGSISYLMRAALGLVAEKRRRPMPKVDPALVREIGRIGGNLNQIARWLNTATRAGHCRDIDALVVAARLVAIERAMSRAAIPRAWAMPERGAQIDGPADMDEPPPC